MLEQSVQWEELFARATVDLVTRQEMEDKLRSGRPLRVKLGIDPTGPRIHLGRAVQLRKLRRFQKQGHLVQLVVGDFTARIGDASDKTAVRRMLTPEEVEANMARYREQIGLILDLDRTEFHYNSTWLGKLGFAEVVGLASSFTVAQMLERENFTLRYQAGKPIGLQEFLYPLMQGYDSVALGSDVELGGTDQIFNMLAGRVLQKACGMEPQCVVTGPLIPGPDGRKMSTSWGNVISILDPPDVQYGQLMSVRDDLMPTYFEACTDVPYQEIRLLTAALAAGAIHPMELKKRLAREVVALYHGEEAASEAEDCFARLVQRREMPEEMPTIRVAPIPVSLTELLAACGLASSKNEARRLIEQGGVLVDGGRRTDPREVIRPAEGMVIRAGKRKYVRLSMS